MNNASALDVMRQLGVSYRTAWLLKHKLMEAMYVREQRRELDGRVQIDDPFLGGERVDGKRGGSSLNKVPFVAAVQTTPASRPSGPRRWLAVATKWWCANGNPTL